MVSLLDYLGMGSWVFRVSETLSEEWAHIDVEDYDEATLSVGPKFWQADPLTKTQVLIHEAFHCPTVRIYEPLKDAIDMLLDSLPKGKRREVAGYIKYHRKSAHRSEERHVNHLAILLAKFAPKWDPR